MSGHLSALAFTVLTSLGYALPARPLADASKPRALAARSPAAATRYAGDLRRRVARHPTIPVAVEATCPDMAAFHAARSLEAECAVSQAPGRTFRAKVAAVQDVRILRIPAAEDIYGLITLEVDNRDAAILPGGRVVASFERRVGEPFMLFGVAGEPGGIEGSSGVTVRGRRSL
jgi:hypothetical protein